jgi:hypothetical protein
MSKLSTDELLEYEIKRMKSFDTITDLVLAYRPEPKTKAAKRRIRRNKRAAKAKK